MNNVATNANFIPTALLSGNSDQCSYWALSFFDSVASARSKFQTFISRGIDAKAVYGDHIGEIELKLNDGVTSSPGGSGHFELHEDSSFNHMGRIVNYYPLSQ
jgi:hypothetical protein